MNLFLRKQDGTILIDGSKICVVLQIKVEDNFFPCNCRVIYLVESVFGKRDPQFLDNNKCISPYKLNGKPMSVMRNNGMLKQCDRKAVMDQAK